MQEKTETGESVQHILSGNDEDLGSRISAQAQLIAQLQQENAALRSKIEQLDGKDSFQDVTDQSDSPTGTDDQEISLEAEQKERIEEPNDSEEAADENVEISISWPTPEETAAWERPARSKPWKGAKRKRPKSKQDQKTLKIVHVSAELAPYAKVGGLGDVVAGLSRACQERGHDVEVILPYYECLPAERVGELEHVLDFEVPTGSVQDGHMHHGSRWTSAFRATVDGIRVILLRPDWNATNLFRGDRIYGGSYNETQAYLYFSRAALEFLKASGTTPNVLHAHEWQTAAVPMLFWDNYRAHGMQNCKLFFTIHNLDSQGECRQDEFSATGVSGQDFAHVDRALDERTIGHNPERLCLMKGGIVYSNAVTTVSPTYADEAVGGGSAGWLKSTFVRPDVREKFSGVLNGIDAVAWDPEIDSNLPAPFSPTDLTGKRLCKTYLQKALGLAETDEKPLVAVITRLVPQKGIHLIRHAIHRTLEKGGQYVLLGTGHADGDFKHLSNNDLRDHPDVKLMLLYSDALAHLIYAAADIILVPSLFEPCGLTQLVGMRYGAVPVVRRTGGLADTVKDVSEGDHGNGYTFDGTDEHSLNSALDRAIETFQLDRERWDRMVTGNMLRDCSWQSSAGQYLDMYFKELAS